jgi:hypothetical protein
MLSNDNIESADQVFLGGSLRSSTDARLQYVYSNETAHRFTHGSWTSEVPRDDGFM